MNIQQILIGLLLAVAIAWLAWRVRSLSLSGAIAAGVLGTLVFGFGGFSWAVLLMGFFISSSGLSRLFKKRKAVLDEKFSKGSQRDAGQVAANGGLAGMAVLLHVIFPAAAWPWWAYAGALAAVNADTWATELGVLSKTSPRLITTWKVVERGESGGISLGGTLAALGGAFLIAVLAGWLSPVSDSFAFLLMRIVMISLVGLAGSLVDSLAGATVQAIYFCPKCNKLTEKHPLHSCGTPTRLKQGWKWMDNDAVNGLCALTGLLLGTVVGLGMPNQENLSLRQLTTILISSPAFENGQTIPTMYTCDGENISPRLMWNDPPGGTKSLALVVSDPDAPMGTYYHWVVYNLPVELRELPEGAGSGNFESSRYGGPCPPAGKVHHYFFTLYTLDLAPEMPTGLKAENLLQKIKGHILTQGEWMGTYSR